jgi:hypothetical protein
LLTLSIDGDVGGVLRGKKAMSLCIHSKMLRLTRKSTRFAVFVTATFEIASNVAPVGWLRARRGSRVRCTASEKERCTPALRRRMASAKDTMVNKEEKKE